MKKLLNAEIIVKHSMLGGITVFIAHAEIDEKGTKYYNSNNLLTDMNKDFDGNYSKLAIDYAEELKEKNGFEIKNLL